jgi:adenylate/nucleoside-diphosphate kinase
LAAWQKEIEPIRVWYKEQHSNLVSIEGQHSKWWVWNKALDTAKASVVQIQTYLQRISDGTALIKLSNALLSFLLVGKAASIADMCITPDEFVSRLGDFDQYCPVALADRGELVDCTTTKSLQFAVEFRGGYMICN